MVEILPLKEKAIVFDMDNTILSSHINFDLMKKGVCSLLLEAGFEIDSTMSVAAIIQAADAQKPLSPALRKIIWDKVDAVEALGMKDAVL
ncbi:MAG: hypothetical protein RR396_04075, partial [Clostridiales bacterium]